MKKKPLTVYRVRIKETGEEIEVKREGQVFEVKRLKCLQYLPYNSVEVLGYA